MGFTLYGALAALALAALLVIAGFAARKRGVQAETFLRFAALAVPVALVFSRVTYVLSSLSYYTETIGHPELIFSLRDGGYSMLGAMLGVFAAAFVAEKWCKLPCCALLDAAALGMPVALIVARLAEPLTGMGWGYPYYSPLFYFLDGLTENIGDFAYTHPVFAYEAITALGILVILWLIRKSPRGTVTLTFLLLYGATQTLWESMLNGGHMKVIHFVKINQVGALVMLLIPLIVWSVRAAKAGYSKRVLSSWLLAVVCILSAVVQEFSVEGQENPYFSVVTVGYIIAGLLAVTAILWCVTWRKAGILRILPIAIAALVAIAAAVVDRTLDVGDHYRLVLWGIMACDMFLLAWTGFSLRAAAENK